MIEDTIQIGEIVLAKRGKARAEATVLDARYYEQNGQYSYYSRFLVQWSDRWLGIFPRRQQWIGHDEILGKLKGYQPTAHDLARIEAQR